MPIIRLTKNTITHTNSTISEEKAGGAFDERTAQCADLEDATQMYYYGARYYDPRISIFVSVDPLAEQTMEPYLYTGNNPIMFTDPTGMNADPIYGANWLGDVKWIGDDDKDDGKSYFVTGKTQSAVEKATKKEVFMRDL